VFIYRIQEDNNCFITI